MAGSGRAGTSRRLTEGELALLHGQRRAVEALSDVVRFEIRVLGEDLVGGHAIGHHRHDRCDRKAEVAHARHATHEPLQPSDVSLLDAWGGELISRDTWDAVAGFHQEKGLIDSRIIAPLAEPMLAREIGVEAPATVMLFGPPGTGKTTFARGIAGRLGWPFVEVAPSKLASGDGLAAELRRAFSELAALEHAVVFIDEFDEIASSRQERREMQGVVNELLKAIPPFRANPGRLLVCATNFIDQIDPAVIRPGRFDLIVPIGPPDPAARTALWEAVLASLATSGVDVTALVARTEGFTPADVGLAAQRAAAVAFDRARSGAPAQVRQEDLLAAIDRTPPSVDAVMLDRFRRDVTRFERV